MVAPSATASESAKNGIPRFAFSEPSIGSTTTCVGPPEPNVRSPNSSEISVKSAPVVSSRRTIASSAAASIATVSSPPLPAPTTGSRSTRDGISASTPLTSSTAARQVASQSVKWLKQKARGELGEEVGGFLRQDVALARAREHVLDPRRPEQERPLGLAAIDRRDRLAALRRVADALRRQGIDDLDVEPVALEQLVAAAPIEDNPWELVAWLVDRRPADAVDRLRKPVGRKDRQSLLADRDEHHHHPGTCFRAVLLVEGERGLVAVVAVGDQELRVGEAPARIVLDAPEPVAARGEVRLAPGNLDRVAVVQQEDRLELGPCRPQESQAPLLRPGVRALVRQDDSTLVGLESKGDHESVADPRYPIRAGVGLRQRPDRRFGLPLEHAVRLPIRELARGLLLGLRQGQMDDVVGVERQVVLTLHGREHVVRRRDKPHERSRRGRIAKRPKGPNLGHRAGRYKPLEG